MLGITSNPFHYCTTNRYPEMAYPFSTIELCSYTLMVFLAFLIFPHPTKTTFNELSHDIFSDTARYFLYTDPFLFIVLCPFFLFFFLSLSFSSCWIWMLARILFSLATMHHAAMQFSYSRVAAKDTLPPEAAAAAANNSVGGSGAGGSADVNSTAVGGANVVVVGQSLPTP